MMLCDQRGDGIPPASPLKPSLIRVAFEPWRPASSAKPSPSWVH